MIAKEFEPENARRRKFEDSINYILGRGDKPLPGKVLKIWTDGVLDEETAAVQMTARASRNRKAREVVSHLLISYAPGEEPTEKQQLEDIKGLLKALGMEGHQFVAASHCDTDILHIHIVVNRIGSDNKCANVIGDYRIHQIFCATVALQRGWKIVPGRFNGKLVKQQGDYQAPQWPMTNGEFKHEQRTGEPPWQDLVRHQIQAARDKAHDWHEFRELLALHGIVLKHTVKKGDFHGLSFAAGHGKDAPGCAASRIDPACRYKALEERFGPWVEPRTSIELATTSSIEVQIGQRPKAFPELTWLVDNLELCRSYAIYRDDHIATSAASRTARSNAWMIEKELRQRTTARRRKNHKAHREAAYKHFKRGVARDMALHEIEFIVRWNKKSDMERAKRRWAEKKIELSATHPISQLLTFRQFVEDKAEKGDVVAQRYLDWLSVQRNRKRPLYDTQVVTQVSDNQLTPLPASTAAPSTTPTSNEGEKENAEMAAAEQRREEIIAQISQCQEIYQDDKRPVIERLRAACIVHIWLTDLETLEPARDSEASDKVGNLLAVEICRGTDTGLYAKLFEGWADEEWGLPLATKIRSTMKPSRDAPQLVELAKAEWAKSHDRSLRPEDRAFAVIERAATASARGEPEHALRMHSKRLTDALAALDAQSRQQLDIQLGTALFKKVIPETDALARRWNSLLAIAKEMRAELRSPPQAQLDGIHLHINRNQGGHL